jgi:hypothetical protein
MECDSLLLLLSPCFWFLNLFRVMPEGWPLSAYNQGFFHTPTELNPFCQKGTMHNFSWSRDLGLHGCSEGWHNAFLFQHNSRKELVHNLQWHLWPCLRYIMRHGLGLLKCRIIWCHCCMENRYGSSYILTDHIVHLKVLIESAFTIWLWERGWHEYQKQLMKEFGGLKCSH